MLEHSGGSSEPENNPSRHQRVFKQQAETLDVVADTG